MDQHFQPVRLGDLAAPLADEDVRAERAARATHVPLAAQRLVLAGEADRQPRRGRLDRPLELRDELSQLAGASSECQVPTATTSKRTWQYRSMMSEAAATRSRYRFSQTRRTVGSLSSARILTGIVQTASRGRAGGVGANGWPGAGSPGRGRSTNSSLLPSLRTS